MKHGFINPIEFLQILFENLSGRRIVFDYDIYGDSPSCLGSFKNRIEEKRGVVQGYGYNEKGKSSTYVISLIDYKTVQVEINEEPNIMFQG